MDWSLSKFKNFFRKIIYLTGLFWFGIFTLTFLFVVYIAWRIPSESEIKGCMVTAMFEVELCPGTKSYVPLKQISKFLQKAVVTAEDGSFYQHQGFDWEALEKSARENLQKGVYKRGGSTITQQLAKNLFLSREKSLFRKFLEALITIKIERTLSKNDILERYLNVVEFGPKIYGVKAAAQFYFKKSAAHLNIAESAFLAMVLPNPIKYSRSFQTKVLSNFARKRMAAIIRSMNRLQKIDSTQYQTALGELDYFFSKETPPPIHLSEDELKRAQEDELDESEFKLPGEKVEPDKKDGFEDPEMDSKPSEETVENTDNSGPKQEESVGTPSQ